MSTGRSHVRLRNLLQLLSDYEGKMPLHLYLQEQFRKHKEWGSSDRRFYREYVYATMRLGKAYPLDRPAERLLLTAFLRNDTENFDAWITAFPLRSDSGDASTASELFPEYLPDQVFPFSNLISSRLDNFKLVQHLQHLLPVYARILPKADKGTMILPPDAELLPANALRLPPGRDHSEWIEDGFLQVQDLGSQMVCNRILPIIDGLCWDLCCGAGGKSLFLAEHLPDGQLYCSDIRSSILENLRDRFSAAGLPLPYTASIDLAQETADSLSFHKGEETSTIAHAAFDTIVADVPCSGSGTWSRNPENLCFFPVNSQTPEQFATLQQILIRNAWDFLKPGGKLHYITCSVYALENEDNARLLCQELGGAAFDDAYIVGYEQYSDTLYHAAWQKPGA
jgi:16S rRNA (cytosine967-C5)-methyltransferase